jgi:hypothetical protein
MARQASEQQMLPPRPVESQYLQKSPEKGQRISQRSFTHHSSNSYAQFPLNKSAFVSDQKPSNFQPAKFDKRSSDGCYTIKIMGSASSQKECNIPQLKFSPFPKCSEA